MDRSCGIYTHELHCQSGDSFSGDPVTRKQMARPFHILHDHIKQTEEKHFACTIISTHWPSDAFRFCPYSMTIIRSIRLINQSRTVPESAVTLHCSRSFVKGAPTFLPSSSSSLQPPAPPYKSSHLTRRPPPTRLSSHRLDRGDANHIRAS